MSDEADEAYSVTEQLTMTGINRIRQKINVHGIPVYLCEACGNPIPEARRKIFPGVTLCVECQAYQERRRGNTMHKSEAEKIDSILDEHQQIYRRHNQINNILAYCACIAWIPCIIAAFGVDGIYLKILFAVLACCGAVCFFIFFFTLLPESLMVLSRQSLLQLMRLTEDVPDARQELLNRLLSGKKLTGRDEQDIRRLWQEKVDAMQESATRQREQDTIRKFTEGNKSE